MASFLDTVSADLNAITDAAAQSYIVRKLLPPPMGAVPPLTSSSSAAPAATPAPAAKTAGVFSGSSALMVLGVILIAGALFLARR